MADDRRTDTAGESDTLASAATIVDDSGVLHVYVPVEVEVIRDAATVDTDAIVQATLAELAKGFRS
jgi:hypothetical protein